MGQSGEDDGWLGDLVRDREDGWLTGSVGMWVADLVNEWVND